MHLLRFGKSYLRSSHKLFGLISLAAATGAGCGATGSDAADGAPSVASDAAEPADAAVLDAGPVFDAAPIGPDAAVSSTSQRALWYGDFTTNGVDEIRLYDGTSGLSGFSMSGVTTIDGIGDLAVSPDGTRVAIALTHDGGTPVLYVANIDGTGTPTTILDSMDAAVDVTDIEWSPDGTQIAYISDVNLDGNKLVFVAPADGGAAPVLVSQDPADAAQDAQTVAWAGNTHVVYRADLVTDTVDNFYISDVSAAPAAPIPLVPENLVSNGAEVSDTAAFGGGKVYFKSNHEGAPQVYRVDPNGSNLEVVPALAALTNGSGAANAGTFAISPDGANIAFSADSPTEFLYQVYVAPLGGTATIQSNLTDMNPTPTSDRGPVGPLGISWSPDGTMLGLVGDWPIDAGDLDNDNAAYIVPATGAAGGVRIIKPGASADSRDVVEVAFTSDSSTFFVLGDLRANNNVELFVTTSLTVADQDTAATLTQAVPTSGDVVGIEIIQ